jgi:hypothetical protein
MASDEVKAAFELLTNEGFLVVKIPPCEKEGQDHGKHTLITRSAMCPGGGTIPHGLRNWHQGSFGMWADCLCGSSFSDYYGTAEDPSDWEKHKIQHPEFF